jgi:hypothetical protein
VGRATDPLGQLMPQARITSQLGPHNQSGARKISLHLPRGTARTRSMGIGDGEQLPRTSGDVHGAELVAVLPKP